MNPKLYDIDRAYAARSLIEENVGIHYTISELCRQLVITETRLKQAFRFVFNKGLFEHLKDKRKEEALRMLVEGRATKDIALSLGYKDSSSFVRFFKTEVRMTPQEWVRVIKSNKP